MYLQRCAVAVLFGAAVLAAPLADLAGGVGQQPAVSPLDFSNGPGGVPLPPAPVSQP